MVEWFTYFYYVSRVVYTPFNYIFAFTETDNINTGLIQSLQSSDLQVLKFIWKYLNFKRWSRTLDNVLFMYVLFKDVCLCS